VGQAGVLNRWSWGILGVLTGAVVGLSVAVGILSRHNAQLVADYQAVLVADNRMTRSRTDFQYPKLDAYELRGISEVAEALLWPWQLHEAAERTENGGMHLELGVQKVPDDIRRNFPPRLWQRAAAVRIMQEEAGRMILQDPDVTYVFAARLARRWNAADVPKWQETFITNLNKARGDVPAVRPGPGKKKSSAERRRTR
jgi:hypothetical protein